MNIEITKGILLDSEKIADMALSQISKKIFDKNQHIDVIKFEPGKITGYRTRSCGSYDDYCETSVEAAIEMEENERKEAIGFTYLIKYNIVNSRY